MELVTLNSETLQALLKGTIVGAGTDKYLPMLNSVRVETRGNTVRVVSTDRYRLVIGEVTVAEGTTVNDGAFNLYLHHVKDLVKVLPVKKDSGDVNVWLSDDGKHVTFTHNGSVGKFVREHDTAIGEYPKYEGLIPKEFGSIENIGFNPVFLGDIAKLPAEKNTRVDLKFVGENRPMFATLEGVKNIAWTYMLMPVRLT